ncbi:acetylcholine receptor subunit alpha-like, partial [Patella vulgata]|uniref:acetylcholine receptor subunit alpha-like n=1 Tax=Patella vulgata TaxID=6465 RepID=UPI0024A82457
MVEWTDELLKWNPDNFGGINIINIPKEKRWLPHIMIINSVHERDLFSKQSSPFQVTQNGSPTFILLNVYLPVIILSFLNAAVFAVPVDSGEKLSYVLTVLLSLAVFMSTVSGMLPTTSNRTPYITI